MTDEKPIKHRIAIDLSVDAFARLERLANEPLRTKTEIVRNAIRLYEWALLRKDEGLVLKTGKMPISHGVVECSLELEKVRRKDEEHFVASVNFLQPLIWEDGMPGFKKSSVRGSQPFSSSFLEIVPIMPDAGNFSSTR